MISPSDFMKKHGFEEEEEKEHTLAENSKARARKIRKPNAGTPHDWEDWERYKSTHDDAEDPDAEVDR
ncbi:MAG: hypothetical protein CME36_14380 [unclassified Hahellaceae]|nr:hypothetical protein [Hahellaceae bacterium]|tara:strand:- start:26596 stop:26799 length:204 start_codon:yes stop_codon:yes gene_type:complete